MPKLSDDTEQGSGTGNKYRDSWKKGVQPPNHKKYIITTKYGYKTKTSLVELEERATEDQGGDETGAGNQAESPQNLKEAEANPSSPSASEPAKNNKQGQANNADPAEDDGLYNEKKHTPSRFRISRRGKVAAGVAGVFVGGFGFIFFMQTPNMMIQHFAELLKGRAAEIQLRHQGHYRRTNMQSISDLFSKEGRRGKKLIAHMERRGYQFRFDREGSMSLVIAPDGTRISSPEGIVGHVDEYVRKNYPLTTSRWKTKRTEAFYNRYKVSRESVITAKDGDDKDPKKAANSRMYKSVEEGVEVKTIHQTPPGGDPNEIGEKVNEHTVLAEGDGSLEEIKKKLREGVSVDNLSPDERKLILGLNSPDQRVLDVVEKTTKGSLGERMFSSIKSFVSSTDVLDKMCTVKYRLRAITFAARHFRALSELRYAAEFIKVADKIRAGKVTAGDISPELVNAIMTRITMPDRNGYYISQSPGFDFILNGKFSKSENDAHKGMFGVDGKLTGIPAAVQAATDNIPLTGDQACKVVQNEFFQIATVIVELGIGAFTGGSGTVATQTVKAGITTSVKTGIEKVLTRQFARQAAKDIGTGAAKDAAVSLSFETAMALMQIYAEKAFSLNFTGQEQGAELGNVLVGGAGVLNTQRSLQEGMVPATAEQYDTALAMADQEKREELKNQSVYARVFDYSNMDSLAFRTMSKIATLPPGINGVTTVLSAGVNRVATVLSNPASLLSGLGNTFFGRASANELKGDEIRFDTYEVKGVKYATTPAGSLQPIMRADILRIDPIENRTALIQSGDIDGVSLEPKSENFREHIKNCVEEVDIITTLETQDQTNPQFDCRATQPITVRYKAHLAYLGMEDSIDSILFADEIR